MLPALRFFWDDKGMKTTRRSMSWGALGVSLSLASCTTSRLDRDVGTREYAERPQAIAVGPVALGGAESLPLAIIGAASVGLNPDYYRSSRIAGRCEIRSEPVSAPCNNVVLLLIDVDSGREVARRPCDAQGAFAFPVEKGRRYRLATASARYTTPPEASGPFTQGEQLVLTLATQAP